MAVLVISYSRQDQPQVRAIVKLLRGAMLEIERAVFWDEDLAPGDEWFEQLKLAIDGAPKLFVMWCEHASKSEQVRREFQYALQQQKTVVPVLIDSTPLCAELAPIHGIDMRHAVKHRRARPGFGIAPGDRPNFPVAGYGEPPRRADREDADIIDTRFGGLIVARFREVLMEDQSS